MSLPDLTNLAGLIPQPRTALLPDAPNGLYCLDRLDDIVPCDSSVILIRNALKITPNDADTQALDAFMSDDANVPQTPNPMNRKTFLKRKQATFGFAYDFGQGSTVIEGPPENWPLAVQKALSVAKQAAQHLHIDPSFYNGVHTNLYPTSDAGVAAHKDSEKDLVVGMPIFSFTLMSGTNQRPRVFQILREQTNEERATQLAAWKAAVQTATAAGSRPPSRPSKTPVVLNEVLLGHGDLLIMQGQMQRHFLHAVPEAKPKREFAGSRRINMTVRAFVSSE